jgi:hypothetical protein
MITKEKLSSMLPSTFVFFFELSRSEVPPKLYEFSINSSTAACDQGMEVKCFIMYREEDNNLLHEVFSLVSVLPVSHL